MPYTAKKDGEIVWPDDVDVDAQVECVECNNDMYVRKGHKTKNGVLKPRCFVHYPDSAVANSCSGGESDTHKLMKYVVTRRFQNMFEHGSVEREQSISGTNRIGDVVVEFDEANPKLGVGVVGEVQYKNDDKDIQAVTEEYLRNGFTVYWIGESDFDEDFETVDLPEAITAWPNGVPTKGEWSGIEEPFATLDEFGSRYPIAISLPPECLEQHRETLKSHWRIGANEYDFDLIYTLKKYNAPRNCATCGDDADFYLFDDNVVSTYRCGKCLPDQATASDLFEQKTEVEA